MRLANISDRKTFAYCKVISTQDIVKGRCRVVAGNIIYAMMYPGNHWHLFNTCDESEGKSYELHDDAKLGIDFIEITETTTKE